MAKALSKAAREVAAETLWTRQSKCWRVREAL